MVYNNEPIIEIKFCCSFREFFIIQNIMKVTIDPNYKYPEGEYPTIKTIVAARLSYFVKFSTDLCGSGGHRTEIFTSSKL